MELSEALDQLNKKLFSYDWYAKKVEKNSILHGSIVAYVHRMDSEVYALVPDYIGPWTVRIHYIASFFGPEKSVYQTMVDAQKVEAKSKLQKLADEIGDLPTTLLAVGSLEREDNMLDVDVSDEIWKLSKLCGWQNLEDIFYEVHDGVNAVTNQSEAFPEVRTKLEYLYELVGFDVLADEIA